MKKLLSVHVKKLLKSCYLQLVRKKLKEKCLMLLKSAADIRSDKPSLVRNVVKDVFSDINK